MQTGRLTGGPVSQKPASPEGEAGTDTVLLTDRQVQFQDVTRASNLAGENAGQQTTVLELGQVIGAGNRATVGWREGSTFYRSQVDGNRLGGAAVVATTNLHIKAEQRKRKKR